jgi:hypothetical protein
MKGESATQLPIGGTMEKRTVKLTPEDHERVKRLHSEVKEKLFESATICARALGSTGKVTKLQILEDKTIRKKNAQEPLEEPHRFEIDIWKAFFQTDDGYCGIEDDENGISYSVDC